MCPKDTLLTRNGQCPRIAKLNRESQKKEKTKGKKKSGVLWCVCSTEGRIGLDVTSPRTHLGAANEWSNLRPASRGRAEGRARVASGGAEDPGVSMLGDDMKQKYHQPAPLPPVSAG